MEILTTQSRLVPQRPKLRPHLHLRESLLRLVIVRSPPLPSPHVHSHTAYFRIVSDTSRTSTRPELTFLTTIFRCVQIALTLNVGRGHHGLCYLGLWHAQGQLCIRQVLPYKLTQRALQERVTSLLLMQVYEQHRGPVVPHRTTSILSQNQRLRPEMYRAAPKPR